ncbi:MAG: FAD-binding oxidoreductase, partial [Gaiellaceae bacterium]
MRWWGWGEGGAGATALPEHALGLLRDELGIGTGVRGPVALEAVRLPAPAIGEGALARLRSAAEVATDHESRVLHAAGKGYVDLVRLRAGVPDGAPDAVVTPRDHAGVRAVLAACAAERLAVVPWGGGTSVVGGLTPLREGFAGVVALDLGGLDGLVAVDGRSRTATIRAGMQGPELEAGLGLRGLTLGHFPQSFEYVTVGGCVATRSAGQASTGYGRIDELVTGLRCAAPAGDIDLAALPPNAAGPDLRELLVGSEGVLGVITEVTLRVRPRPPAARHEAWMLPSFLAGAEAFRVLEQAGAAPDVARLSDAEETRLNLAMGGPRGRRKELFEGYLRLRGVPAGGCVAIVGFDGDEPGIGARRTLAAQALRREGGVGLGAAAGRAWVHGRFRGPYLRDHLLDRGVMAETLETATTWNDLAALYAAVGTALRAALDARGTPPLVMCHISHLYPNGASLYFTFLARQEPGAEVDQWRAAKRAASDAIAAAGATITHHHA